MYRPTRLRASLPPLPGFFLRAPGLGSFAKALAVTLGVCLAGVALFAPVYAGVAPSSPSALHCDSLEGVDALIFEPGTVLLFGELHGTKEAPAVVADVACAALDRGVPLHVGLELPHQESTTVQTYLRSAGTAEDRRALLSGPFWQREYQDGRSSGAVAALIEDLRSLVADGHPVTTTLFDSSEKATSGQSRDRAMAKRLGEAIREHPSHLFLVLTGNIHARLRPGTPWDEDFEPMGFLVQKQLPDRRILAFDFSSTGGTAWTCTSAGAEDCHARRLGGRGEGTDRKLTLLEEPDDKGFHGYYHVGEMTASSPAVAP